MQPYYQQIGKMHQKRAGFTLIELSIVLVIIALLAGGILVGRDLINAAAIRAQITQIEKYNQAVNTFKGKYGYLPGDIPDPTASQFGFKPRGTCGGGSPCLGEGDGNGVIQGITADSANAEWDFAKFTGEEGMFWVDLSKAGLIDGSFTVATPNAVSGTSVIGSALNQYFPQAKMGSGGYVYVWSGGFQGFLAAQGGDGNNYFAVTGETGTNSMSGGGSSSVPLMTVAQAYAIDKKVDDGLPQTGRVLAIDGSDGWAAGGPVSGNPPEELNNGDSSSSAGPATSPGDIGSSGLATNSPYNCYDGSKGLPEQYSISINNGTGVNCWLSFRFQ